jgi:hypothetical protein
VRHFTERRHPAPDADNNNNNNNNIVYMFSLRFTSLHSYIILSIKIISHSVETRHGAQWKIGLSYSNCVFVFL